MKMILQENENLVHVQQQFGVSFCEKKLILNLNFPSRYGIINV